MKTLDYLEELKTRTGWSEYRIEKEFDLSEGTVAHWRRGRSIMNDTACAMLQDALGIKDDRIIYAANEERAKKEKEREYWRKKMQAIAAMVLCGTGLLAVTSIVTPSPAQAAQNQQVPPQLSVLCSIRNAAKRAINRAVAVLNMRAAGKLRFGFSG